MPNRLGAGAARRRKRFGKKPRTEVAKRGKMHAVMSEFKRGTLHSGSGEIVTKRPQAIAIGLSEAGLSRRQGRGKARRTQKAKTKSKPRT